MQHSLFISDLHLSAKTLALRKRFFQFLEGPAREAESLYILGDLFETWIGDDDIDSAANIKIVNALKELTDSGTALFVMHGNRDFLLSHEFAQRTGATLLNDPTDVILYGVRTILTHGDQLCTEDVEYQQWRKQVRSPQWQKQVLALPIEQRRKMASDATSMSADSKKKKSMDIMDVSTAAVMELIRKNDYPRIIHGHTHRPARHVYHIDDHTSERWVLTDWNNQKAGYLYCDRDGCRAITF
ncbi:MAG: UDP-2,3-diacylglucosamine diphosphatase [Betaproteobacteria bacterium]|nr:UDP-2,3-diacylglucosamine diphosphatase [Betaproteobacteria bacterium]